MKHNNFLLLGILVFPILLSACGGGSSSSSTTATNSATTINGITVPSAPDPVANNATLAGVDSNNNGVRDDVERKIAALSKQGTYDAYTLQLVKLEQRLATKSIATQIIYNDIQTQKLCIDRKRPDIEKSILTLTDIKNATVNSRERSAKYTENAKNYEQGFLPVGDVTCP